MQNHGIHPILKPKFQPLSRKAVGTRKIQLHESLPLYSRDKSDPGNPRNREIIQNLLSRADIRIDGQRPWDIRVHNDRFYDRLLAHGSIGAGESYMDGWWDCDQIDEMIDRVLRANIENGISAWHLVWETIKAKLFNLQRPSQAFHIGERHYDLGNQLYAHMLDRRMVYSCGYWKEAATLDEAQEKKLDLICRKIALKPGMRILDIGCGWGGFAKYAAEKYVASVLGVTVSKEQVQWAKRSCQGLPVEIRLQDYRDLEERFDRIVSVGMFEHVGYKNYRRYMKIAHRCLADDGLFLLHTIGSNESQVCTDPWLEKYIFPGAMIPSVTQIGAAIEGLFILEDWHNFGPDYDLTLMCWFKNFEKNWGKLKSGYDERFYRMWKFYLLSCAGSFRARQKQLWQVLLSKGSWIRCPR